jgi:predicted RNase H-like HicB family nuclease
VKKYTYNVLLVAKEDGGYRAYCPTLSGCRAYGDTKREAVQNIRISILHRLEKLKAGGKPIPADTGQAS